MGKFDFNEFVENIRGHQPVKVVPLLDYLSNELVREIISMLTEKGVKPGEKYFFDKALAHKLGFEHVFKSMTYMTSEQPFTDTDYRPLKINGLYHGIWLALNAHDRTDREEPCVLVNGNIIYYAEKIYNYLLQMK